MLRSLYASISGMKVNQTKLDVIGNNLANVGTTAFKYSRVRFQDMLSQSSKSATGPMNSLGGTNPSQVGLGVQMAGIDSIVSQGMMQPTSRNLDVAIDGSGYFMVSKGKEAFTASQITLNANNTVNNTNGRDISYTRDGSFAVDSAGYLVTSDGYRVLGYSVAEIGTTVPSTSATMPVAVTAAPGNNSMTAAGAINYVNANATNGVMALSGEGLKTLKIPDEVIVNPTSTPVEKARIISFSIEKDGLIKATLEGGKIAVIGQIAMASVTNPAGMEKVGQNLYKNTPNSGDPVVRTGIGTPDRISNDDAYGDMLQGMLEMSNVDIAEQFTDMIVAQRAFQAAGKMISTDDEILQDIINLKR